tara:strand:- start:51 stop:1289 length:1239 start_codon:yes stop_codon:yes gene_type:complete
MMTSSNPVDPILLTEYEDTSVTLAEDDYSFLVSDRISKKIQLSLSPEPGAYLLNPHQHVGVIQLPSGRMLESRPKVPFENIFYMVARSMGMPWVGGIAKLERFDDVLELIAELFADESDHLISRGLSRRYQEQEDNLINIKGRIDFNEDLRLNTVLRHRTYCRYEDLTVDIPENQVVLQTAEMLSGWRFGNKDLRARIRNITQRLSVLSKTNFSGQIIDQFIYNRMTEHYRPVHRLCKLLLDQASLSEYSGMIPNPAFIIDMNKLFEKFISEALKESVGARSFSVQNQSRVYLDTTKIYRMQPDIVIRNNRFTALVADCKYKKLTVDQDLKSSEADMYQVLSYCTVTKSRHGVLIYPQHEVGHQKRIPIVNSSAVIQQMTVDMGGSIDDLESSIRVLANDISALILGDSQIA